MVFGLAICSEKCGKPTLGTGDTQEKVEHRQPANLKSSQHY